MKPWWLVLVAILPSACAWEAGREDADEPLLIERFPIPPGRKPRQPMPWDPGYGQQSREVPAHMVPKASEPAPVPFGNPAVFELVQQAERGAKAGDWSRADASLERALRLEPDNPYLWFRRADFELRRERAEEAVTFAAKSNSLAGNDHRLRAWNWQTIAEAQRRLGNPAGARAAEEKAREHRDREALQTR